MDTHAAHGLIRNWNIFILAIFLVLIFVTLMEKYSTHTRSAGAWNKTETNTEHEIHLQKIRPYFLNKLHADDNPKWGNHRLGVIIPMRDTFEELMKFVPYMHNFLNIKKIRHIFFAVNQVDGLRFNRASLINVGFLQAEPLCDYIAMHDVDLLPVNKDLNYSFPSKGPYHVAAPDLHPKYHYKTFVGGILLLTVKHFRLVNGLSNNYWGWGREDDEFYTRMMEKKLHIYRPRNITTGMNTFNHMHGRKRKRDYKRYYDQKKKEFDKDRETGVSNLKYRLESTTDTTFDGAPVTVVNIKLVCDLGRTPWCVTPNELEAAKQNLNLQKAKKIMKGASKNITKVIDELHDKVADLPPVDMDDFILPSEWYSL